MNTHDGILFSNQKKLNSDTFWKHCAMWKNPVTKDHILYTSVYMKYPE